MVRQSIPKFGEKAAPGPRRVGKEYKNAANVTRIAVSGVDIGS
jgi:hypothetical protein